MVRPCDEDERGAHSEKIARCGQRKEERWKDACKRDMTEAELKDMITSGVVNERHYIRNDTSEYRTIAMIPMTRCVDLILT